MPDRAPRRSSIRALLLGTLVLAALGGVAIAVGGGLSHERRNAVGRAERRLHAIKPLLRENAVAAELGVLKGDFSRLIVRELRPARLHLVDPWYLLGAEWQWEKGDRSTAHALDSIKRDLASEIARGQVVLNVAFDQDFLATVPDGYFDWVYLDTTHEYEQTKIELQLLQRKVKPSGVIAGDDWQPDPAHPHHGVYKAVRELTAQGEYQILRADTRDLQWAIGRVTRFAGRP